MGQTDDRLHLKRMGSDGELGHPACENSTYSSARTPFHGDLDESRDAFDEVLCNFLAATRPGSHESLETGT